VGSKKNAAEGLTKTVHIEAKKDDTSSAVMSDLFEMHM
jgi:hypothetical protein